MDRVFLSRLDVSGWDVTQAAFEAVARKDV